jgi:Zn finger protein HypA/HybF involved in hydrogenase expression
MSRKTTQAEFIEKATRKHGGKYLYTKAVYVGDAMKLTITCPDHGDFKQTPSNHLQGQGCMKCRNRAISEATRSNTDEFTNKAVQLHGDKYTYANTVYRGRHTKLAITCHQHGDFEQDAGDHLGGHGCPKCKNAAASVRKRSNLEEFIERAIQLHRDKYTYSKAVYRGSGTKLTITCLVHGGFKQNPNDHLAGHGCAKCRNAATGAARRSNLEEFVEKAKEVHRGKYTYANAVYVNNWTKLLITCPEHGDFKQIPNSHLTGTDCPQCGIAALSKALRSTTAEFVARATLKHHGRYTYAKAVYQLSAIKLTITCPEHGGFKQTPSDHLSGVGCPRCNESRGEKAICGILDAALQPTGVEYVQEHRIPECRRKRPLPFDFALIESGAVVGLVEYHGKQHYTIPEFWGMSKLRADSQLADVQERDAIKVRYARAQGIPLLVIPYWDFNEIEALVRGFVQSL